MSRPQAVPTVQVSNHRVIVTEWRFAPGAETGWHRHGHDYVVVPQTDGLLLLESAALTVIGVIAGLALMYVGLLGASAWVETRFASATQQVIHGIAAVGGAVGFNFVVRVDSGVGKTVARRAHDRANDELRRLRGVIDCRLR